MTEPFPRCGWFRRGYNPEEVDAFFETAREAYESGVPAEQFSATDVSRVVFGLTHGGYLTTPVDAALARMARAFIVRDRDAHIAVNGEDAWMQRVARRATTLYPRMTRPAGERFAHPKGRGYNAQDVDALLDRLVAYFDDGEEIEIADVAGATFRSARADKAYEEGIVDAYLDRAVEILQSVA